MFDARAFIPTSEQQHALSVIRSHIFEQEQPHHPLRMLIYGEAASGKRTLASMVADMYNSYGRGEELVCTSILSNVTWAMGGYTMNALSFDASGYSDDEIREKWEEWTCIFILNVEQASASMFDDITGLLRRGKGSADPFGGMNVIVSADFMQSFCGPYVDGDRLYIAAHLLSKPSSLRGRAAFLLLTTVVVLQGILA